MPSMDKILKVDPLELISPVVNPLVSVAIRVASKEVKVEDPVAETDNLPHCLSVTLVLRPNKAALRDSFLNVVPLRLLESLWAMMVELKVLPTLNLRAPIALKRLSK